MVRPQSLYYLLCYAWDHADLAARNDVAGVASDRVEDLLGHVLAVRTGELLRRGLHREYVTRDEELRSPRGKIDVPTHIKRVLQPAGRVACTIDELDHDVLMNQVVRTTGERLLSVVTAANVRRDLHNVILRLPSVATIAITDSVFARLRLHRLTVHYRFVLNVCELVHRSLVPDASGRWAFVDFTGDQRKMGLLFEDFVRNFLRREQSTFKVGRDRIDWPMEALTAGSDALLPEMQTDMTLTMPGRCCVIETKFYAEPLREGRSGGRRLREAHLYQLFAYLRHLAATGKAVDVGVLLYATKHERFVHRYRLGQQEIHVRALDLDQSADQIAGDLRAIVASLTAVESAA